MNAPKDSGWREVKTGVHERIIGTFTLVVAEGKPEGCAVSVFAEDKRYSTRLASRAVMRRRTHSTSPPDPADTSGSDAPTFQPWAGCVAEAKTVCEDIAREVGIGCAASGAVVNGSRVGRIEIRSAGRDRPLRGQDITIVVIDENNHEVMLPTRGPVTIEIGGRGDRAIARVAMDVALLDLSGLAAEFEFATEPLSLPPPEDE